MLLLLLGAVAGGCITSKTYQRRAHANWQVVLDTRKMAVVGSTWLESPGIGALSRYRLPYSAGKCNQWGVWELSGRSAALFLGNKKAPPFPMGLSSSVRSDESCLHGSEC